MLASEFSTHERRRTRRTNRLVCVIAALAICIYVASAPFYLTGGALKLVLAASTAFLLLASAYFLTIRSNFYLKHGWVDAAFFLAAFSLQTIITKPYAAATQAIGLGWTALLIINTANLSFAAAATIAAAPVAAVFSILVMCCGAMALLANTQPSMWAFLASAMPLGTAATVCLYASYAINRNRRRAFDALQDLAASKARVETLLYGVLPKEVAERLRENASVADPYFEVSTIFIDIVGFSEMTRSRAPRHLVEILNSFFSTADDCARDVGIERVKTVGDAYFAIAGARHPVENSAVSAIKFARLVREKLALKTAVPGESVKVRIGIHTGHVVGGVIGNFPAHYDYWGDTVNVASRLQQHAQPDEILASETTYYRSRGEMNFAQPSLATLKGIGELKVYSVI